MYKPYSYSRIQTYNTCPYKFKLQYIDKIESCTPINNSNMIIGKISHEILENKFNNVSTNERLDKSYNSNDIKIAEKKINKFINENDIYKKISQEIIPIEVEMNIGIDDILNPCDYNDIYVLLRGSIDFFGKHKETGKYIICDWKTGKYRDYSQGLNQLALYAYYILKKYNLKEIVTFFVFIDSNKFIKKKFTLDEAEQEIQKYMDNIMVINKDREFKKKINNLCSYCQYRDICHIDERII